jgi:hypothetical protein
MKMVWSGGSEAAQLSVISTRGVRARFFKNYRN